jgi:hypothetical protein
MTRRAGSTTLVTGIDVFPLASLICPSGPEVVVVVVVVVVVGVDVDVVLVVVLVDVDVDVELDVELLVEPVDVESVVPVVVVSANGLSGPAVPALAK